jgi:predicted nucleic acid-binding protein
MTMREFFDTSVFIAAFRGDHPQHESSVGLVAAADREHSAAAVHSLAEVYSVMSVLPVKPVIPPEQVLLFLEEIRERCTLITLDAAECFETIRKTAEKGFVSGRVYDALLLRCAIKAEAETIYTWNVEHFEALAPELSGRIRTPSPSK